MYSMLLYTLFVVLLFILVIRFMAPFLWILFIAYIIYYIYRLFKYRQFIKTVNKAEEAFREEWQNVKESSQYQSRANSDFDASDVIEADYKVKDEH